MVYAWVEYRTWISSLVQEYKWIKRELRWRSYVFKNTSGVGLSGLLPHAFQLEEVFSFVLDIKIAQWKSAGAGRELSNFTGMSDNYLTTWAISWRVKIACYVYVCGLCGCIREYWGDINFSESIFPLLHCLSSVTPQATEPGLAFYSFLSRTPEH